MPGTARSTRWSAAPEAVARARLVLEAFAGRIVETGPLGTGHSLVPKNA